MSRTTIFAILVIICLILLFLYATNLFALTVVYRLELIEQDLDFIMRRVLPSSSNRNVSAKTVYAGPVR